jgi:peptidyl-prolyl cis-trans isomerase B (cyclophilin B)
MPSPLALRPAGALLAAAALLLAGCGGGDDGGGGGGGRGAKPTATATGTQTDTGCRRVATPAPKKVKLSRPSTTLSASGNYVATVRTSCGDFRIALDAKRAPRTGGSFLFMARKGLYDHTTFHRVVPGFVIQGGDPKGDGTGGPGYSVVEAPPKGLRYTKGVVAMAKTQFERPGTSGSQFFVVTADDAKLPPEYALLGRVTGGQDVVARIAAADTDAQQRPVQPIVIDSITIDAH